MSLPLPRWQAVIKLVIDSKIQIWLAYEPSSELMESLTSELGLVGASLGYVKSEKVITVDATFHDVEILAKGIAVLLTNKHSMTTIIK